MNKVFLAFTCLATLLFPSYVESDISGHETIKIMFSQNNLIRKVYGKMPQKIDNRLCNAAQNHAEYMARHSNMSHDINGTPSARAMRFGWHNNQVYENIAYGQITIREVFTDWVHSPTHYKSMMADCDCCGFGLAYSKHDVIYWCVLYARSKLDKKK